MLTLWFFFLAVFLPFGILLSGLWSRTKGTELPPIWECLILGRPDKNRTGHMGWWFGAVCCCQPPGKELLFLGSPFLFFQVVKTLAPPSPTPHPRWQWGPREEAKVATVLLLVWAIKGFWATEVLPVYMSAPHQLGLRPWVQLATRHLHHFGVSCFHNSLVSLWKQMMDWKK